MLTGTSRLLTDDASIRVVLVDDSSEFAEATRDALLSIDDRFHIDIETVGASALDRLEGTVDCLVVDYAMPDMDGLELLQAARERIPDLPVIFFTGRGSEDIASEAISAGATDYLQKGARGDVFSLLANRIENAVLAHRVRVGYRRIFEEATDGIVLHDPESGSVVDVNERFCTMVGLGRDELLGSSVEAFSATDAGFTQAKASDHLRSAFDDGDRVFEWTIRASDGEEVPVEVNLTHLALGTGEYVLAIVRDITDRKRFERTLKGLYEATTHLVAAESAEAVYELTIDAAEHVLDFELCCVVIYEKEKLRPKALSSGAAADDVRPMDPSQGDAGWVFEHGEPRLTRNTHEDAVSDPAKESFRSGLTVPIGTHGIFQAVSTDPDDFTPADLELAEILAAQASATLDRLAAERHRLEERDRLRSLFENTNECIVEVKFDKELAIIQSVNPAFAETFGVDSSTCIGDDLDALIVPNGERTNASAINDRVADGEVVSQEVDRIAADGVRSFLLRTAPFSVRGERRAFVIYLDITERKRQQERFQSFIEHSSDVISVLDLEGNYRYQSPSIRRHLGYDPRDTIGENAFDMIHPDDRENVRSKFLGAIDDPSTVSHVEYRIRHNDGRWRWFESVGNNQLNNPAIEGFVVNSRDVTRRVQRERELERQYDRLERFSTVVSHDLRNPLTIAKGHVELAIESEDIEHLWPAIDAHDRMEALLEGTLELARQGRTVGNIDQLELANLADECWEMVSSGEASLEVVDDLSFAGDSERIKQVLENLFRNAVEHAGPSVRIRIGAMDDHGFFVEDDGPGIPEEDHDRILEPGFTTREEGTGFGLAIVAEIVEAHGWGLRITDAELGGTRFEIIGFGDAVQVVDDRR